MTSRTLRDNECGYKAFTVEIFPDISTDVIPRFVAFKETKLFKKPDSIFDTQELWGNKKNKLGKYKTY